MASLIIPFMQIVIALMHTVQEEQTSTHDIMYHYYDVYINHAEKVNPVLVKICSYNKTGLILL